MTDILSMTKAEVRDYAVSLGESAFRGDQIFGWMRRGAEFSEMKNIPAALREKLSEEGLFDEAIKKPLPTFPQKIGIVTSPDAAALQDMLNIISRRYPIAEVVIFPCLVQGENAPSSICTALKKADKCNLDIIIVGRGGGSLEDLMAFNSESVARTIFLCNTPIISAVGHETDTTISDYAADLRAPTPSAAAELAVPEISALNSYINSIEITLNKLIIGKITELRQDIDIKEQHLKLMLPAKKIETSRKTIDNAEQRINNALKNKILLSKAVLAEKSAALDNLSPLKIMNRGYSLVYKDKKIIKSSSALKSGDKIDITLADGQVSAVIE